MGQSLAITHFPFQFGSAFGFGWSECVSIMAQRVRLSKNPTKSVLSHLQ